jgi:hypothetical protein
MSFDKLFGTMVLPVKPPVAANGASIQVFEAEEDTGDRMGGVPAFFGGYADDLLGDLGFDVAAEEPKSIRSSIKPV